MAGFDPDSEQNHEGEPNEYRHQRHLLGQHSAAVKDAFAANFAQNGDVGASVAVVKDGELVVDLWGGHQDAARTKPWQRDTIINVFSTTKTMSCLSLLVLASRGLVDVDAPVEKYWPEFGQNGKGNVLVRHLLSHTAGLPAWDQRLDGTDLYDWDKVTDLLADTGHVVGARLEVRLSRRDAGQPRRRGGAPGRRTLGRPVLRRGDRPAGGRRLPHRDRPRARRARRAGDSRAAAAVRQRRRFTRSPTAIRFPTALRTRACWRNSRGKFPGAAPRSRPPAAMATRAAWHSRRPPFRTAARCAASSLLSKQTIDRIFDVQAAGRDLVLGIGVTFGVGYGLNSPRNPISPNARVCYWGGWGGSLVVNDVDAGFTMAYVMNRMGEGTVGDDRAHTLLRAIYASLGMR